jgi:hypothetical protein
MLSWRKNPANKSCEPEVKKRTFEKRLNPLTFFIFYFNEYPAACCGDGQETVLRKWARNFKGSVKELGMTPMDCIAAAAMNKTRKGGISRYQTVVFRCSGGSCLF